MARVTFEKDQPIQNLSGTYGGISYRPAPDGHTSAYVRQEMKLPKNATAEQRAAYRRHVVIDHCEIEVQRLMPNAIEAMDRRRAIRMRVARLYNKYNDDKLPEVEVIGKIMDAYKQKRLKNEIEKD